ncbi:MAG: urease accessory protein, partial [Pseudomonas sp.]|nr:urease accessory protein [Pseudomonas sp.]
MNLPAALFTPSWPAELELAYARHGERTTPVQRRHLGPLR